MITYLSLEWIRLKKAIKRLNGQTAVVLLSAAVLLVIQFRFGNRATFRDHFEMYFDDYWRGLLAWGYWFTMQGLTGFIIPLLILIVFFRRRPAEIGLGLGDWRLALVLAILYLPLATIGTWILSAQPDFQVSYPHYTPAALDWRLLLVYEILYVFYWIGWEYLWRGFLLFGTAPTFGIHAIFVQMVPFVTLHLNKPTPEVFLSIVGGLALGALVWRCRSFWIAVPIHAVQMLTLDLWCTLRVRTGVSGIDLGALVEIFRTL